MRFHLFQLWFLIPGIPLVFASVYIPLSYLHKQIFWIETEARIMGRENTNVATYSLMDFTDTHGTVQHIRADDENTFFEGKDSDHVRIYFDENNPSDYELVNHFRYMLILFLPLGLLSCYLGWPEKVQSVR